MAEAPSELAAEITKLEQKHAENPEGRYFVPLANAYRKAGELSRAEALLRDGLALHPDYLSAHIVLGRCLADRGATEEASDEFRFVLSVDSQNLIALRTLGEIAAAEGRTEDADRWYRELLAVDPMNDDARAYLEGVHPTAEQADTASVTDTAELTDSADVDEWTDERATELEHARNEPAEAIDAEAADAEWMDAGPAEVEAEDGGVELYDGAFASLDMNRDEPAPEPDAAVDFDTTTLDVEWEYTPPEPAAGPGDSENATPPDVRSLVATDDAFDLNEGDSTESGTEAEDVVTETLADLYARQGFLDRAAEVYRKLLVQRGDDPDLCARLEELEARAADAAVDDSFAASFSHGFEGEPSLEAEISVAEPVDEVAAPVDEVAELAGPLVPEEASLAGAASAPQVTIAEYLTGLLAWKPAGVGVGEMEVEPPNETPESAGADEPSFTFDASFLEDTASETAPPEPPRSEPAEIPGSAADWSESAAEPGAEAAPGDTATEDEDLESFQAWLRSLKR